MRRQISEIKDRELIDAWYAEAKRMSEQSIKDDSLAKFIKGLCDDYTHDYGTCCHAIAAATVATAYAMANEMQITGFQWGCAMMEVLGKTLMSTNKMGFAIKDYDNILYPQSVYYLTETEISKETAKEIVDMAKGNLATEVDKLTAPCVVAWWKKLASG